VRVAPEVSAVVLTWNSAIHIPRALAALQRQAQDVPTEIIVVDNGSADGSPDLARTCAPDAQIVRSASNLGVARARNRGMAQARGRFILLLDIDTEMHPASLATLVGFLAAHPTVGVAGPRLVSPDGTTQFSCRRFPTLQGKLLRQLPQRVQARFPLVADEELHHIDRSVAQPVDYVIGACQLIRRATLDAVGPLDERMFYGPEDVDFCLRVRSAGWDVYYVPSAVVTHAEQRITRRQPGLITLRHGFALAYYFWKHRYAFRRPSGSREAVGRSGR
jgi:GT2 family glycosyltransferase